jgi:hypothetical protein
MLGFHPYFDIRLNQDGRVVSCRRWPYFTRNEILWYSFPLEAEWTPELLNADRRIGSPENFQEPHRDPKPGTSVLYRSASTNCDTGPPVSAISYMF